MAAEEMHSNMMASAFLLKAHDLAPILKGSVRPVPGAHPPKPEAHGVSYPVGALPVSDHFYNMESVPLVNRVCVSDHIRLCGPPTRPRLVEANRPRLLARSTSRSRSRRPAKGMLRPREFHGQQHP